LSSILSPEAEEPIGDGRESDYGRQF
jgi:hypothetical protein